VSAKHALLGLLLHKPAYRYQLGDRLKQRLGPAWKINSGQLYQTIKKMQLDGLIERIDRAADDQDDRHIFAITVAGAEEFERWFEEGRSGARLLRRPLLVKITLAGPERLESALKQIDTYERDCAARLKELAREQDKIPIGGSRVRADHVLLRLALSGDITHVEGELGWSRHAFEMVSRLKNQDAIWPSTDERPEPAKKARDRESAREELFGRIAARRRRPTRDEPEQENDDG
jgi:DNA-binding PadR family transcriptional regulator